MSNACPRCGHERPVDSIWMTCSKCGLHVDDWERYDREAEAVLNDGEADA